LRGMDIASGQVFANVRVGAPIDTSAGIVASGSTIWVADPADDQLVGVRPRTPHCPKTRAFGPSISPSSGRPGTRVTVSGPTPYATESGQYEPARITEVQVWWNVH